MKMFNDIAKYFFIQAYFEFTFIKVIKVLNCLYFLHLTKLKLYFYK
jgi:hypothetical protein